MAKSTIEKVYWKDIRDEVDQVNIDFASLVDNINPNEGFPIYVLTFPYGEIVGDDISQFIPDNNGNMVRLQLGEVEKDIFEDLGYGSQTSHLVFYWIKKLNFMLICHINS